MAYDWYLYAPGGFPPGPTEQRLRATIGGMPPTVGYVTVGTWEQETVLDPWIYTGPEDYTVTCLGTMGTMYLYKMRDSEPMPDYENGPSSPCHPMHLGMKHAWGSPDYDLSLDADVCSRTVTDQTMVPSWAPSGGGTTDIAAVSVWLAFGPSIAISGEVGRISNVKFTILGEEYAVSFAGFSETSGGCRCVGEDGALVLYVDDWTDVPSGGVTFLATVYAPVIIDFDLQGFDWGVEASGSSGPYGGTGGAMEFDVPRNYPDPETESMVDQVSTHYVERRTYWNYSWKTGYVRPWSLSPMVNAAWAAANYENVDPTDLPCTIEERGLDHTLAEGEEWPDWHWDGFKVGRAASLNVQKPLDATSLPSAWTTSSPGMAVSQAGETTTVDVGSTTSNGKISRTFLTMPAAAEDADYYAWLINVGLETYDLPAVYRYLLHLETCDIWNWCQFPVIAIGYDSDKAVTLTLRVLYSLLDVTDTRVTGSTRTEDFIASGVTRTAGQVLEYDVEFGAGAGTVYVDLAREQDIKLQHVDGIEISGFNGDGDWQWKLTSLQLVAKTPDGMAGGKTTLTATFPRPSAGLPICYIALRTTADGQRCCNPPDEAVTLCGEEGLDFCDRLTGVNTGIIMDRMVALSSWFITLARQEGMSVGTVDDPTSEDYTGFACDPSHATYQAAFWDGDKNDMLGGTLYTGDVCEVLDLEIASDGTETIVPVKPRVGRVYLCAGVPLPCIVRKHVRGNTHGCVRDANGRVANASVYSFERNPADGTIVQLQTDTTDDWGRWSRKGLGGGREQWRIAATTTDSSAGITSWLKVYNELRQWVGSFDETIWYPNLDIDAGGVVWITATDGDTRVHVGYLDPKANETVWVERPFGGARGYEWPSIACLDDGGLLVAATYNEGTVFARSRDRGATWSTITMAIGSGYQYGDICQRNGVTYCCGWESDHVRFAASSETDLSEEALAVGVTELDVCDAAVAEGAEKPRSSIVVADDRGVVVAVSQDGDLRFYRCRSYSAGFSEVVSA